MAMTENINRRVVLKVEMSGCWTVSDFSAWLSTLDDLYLRLSAFFYLTEGLDYGKPEAPWRYLSWHPHGPALFPEREDKEAPGAFPAATDPFSVLLRAVARNTDRLEVRSLRMGSPGIAEFLGSLNPLKLIADFVTAWRHENTERRGQDLKRAGEREALLADLFKTLLDRANGLSEKGNTETMERFNAYALDRSLAILEEMARDSRLRSMVTVHDVSNRTDQRHSADDSRA